jgi:hypothetical protein
MAEQYEIRVEGHLDAHWSERLAGLELRHLAGGETLLAGTLPDQAALHGLLERIRDLNLNLISVTRGGSSHTSIRRGGLQMNAVVISYSWTGNNKALAARVADALGAEHVQIAERKRRTQGTIVWDVLLKRTPKVVLPPEPRQAYDWVLFVGPVWMGQVASPFRACFEQLGPKLDRYAYVSISGGADGPNPKLAAELEQRLGKAPACVIDLHAADLLPPDPKPTRQDTMAYRVTKEDVQRLADQVVEALGAAREE